MQEADVTELVEAMISASTMKMNDQWQLFKPLVNCTID